MSERDIVCEDLKLAIDDLKREGFRLDVIYPADDPKTAVLSRGVKVVRISLPGAPALPTGLPDFEPQFVLSRAGATAGKGRAGMLYRDLIPGRLGGRVRTRVFQGNHWLFQVETPCGLVTVIRQNAGGAVPGEGDAVRLTWRGEDMTVSPR